MEHLPFSNTIVTPIIIPITPPPAIDATVPPTDIAPFVPGGTDLSVVISFGRELDNTPNSDANVSPRQHAKCLPIT